MTTDKMMIVSKFYLFMVFLMLDSFNGSLAQRTTGSPIQYPIYSDCETPYSRPGKCKELSACPSLVNVQRRYNNYTDAREYLAESICNTERAVNQICCPTDETFMFMPTPVVSVPQIGSRISVNTDALPNTTICGQRPERGPSGNRNDYPWIALLEYTKPQGKGVHCMGVLISPLYVLTVAHCVNGSNMPENWRLSGVKFVDEWNSNTTHSSYLDVPIESTTVHESFNSNDRRQYNDITLLRLAQPVTFTASLSPICLPIFDEGLLSSNLTGRDLHISGWIENYNKPNVHVTKGRIVQGVSHFNCTGIYQMAGFELSIGQTCAGRHTDGGICQRAAGAPLMIQQTRDGRSNWYLVGLNSFGPSNCQLSDWPEVYTRIGSYGDWISNNLRE